MGLLSFEHSRAAYRADFLAYGTAISTLTPTLLWASPPGHAITLIAAALLGLLCWPALEYGLHRYVLHGVPPFKHWHALHHARPTARLGSPTVLSASLIVALVFIPAWALSNAWTACALALGVATGYLAYGLTHHATHHSRSRSAWLARRKHWHALHHFHAGQQVCFGVTSSLWDQILGSTPPGSPRRRYAARTDAAPSQAPAAQRGAD